MEVRRELLGDDVHLPQCRSKGLNMFDTFRDKNMHSQRHLDDPNNGRCYAVLMCVQHILA